MLVGLGIFATSLDVVSQCGLMIMIFSFFLLINAIAHPFRKKIVNHIEDLSMQVMIITLAFGLLASIDVPFGI